MAKTETIQVLGRGTNVDFTIDDAVPFELAERSLREYLMACRGLYSRGTVSINVGRRILAPDQMSTIRGILNQETGLTVSRYWCSPDVLRKALDGPECRRALPSPNLEFAADVSAESGNSAGFVSPKVEQQEEAVELEDGVGSVRGQGTEKGHGQQLSMLFPELDEARDAALTVQIPIVMTETVSEPSTDVENGKGHVEEAPAVSGEENVSPGTVTSGPGSATTEEETKEQDAWQVVEPPQTSSVPENEIWSLTDAWSTPDDHTLLIKHTCRSGEVVKHHGDVVVYGDVNPGAEIVAGGDIMVLGALRGMAHAGAEGNPKATIFALKLESHRLQIGSHVGEAPRTAGKPKRNGRSVNPQIAFLRRRTIYVAPFTQRREEYGGGTPYEG
ncbi:MAG: hypothetical protein OXE17_11080 [Chloroflexi bacterium]|nr:hypothetical protein [Chloroflexota bacterium]